MKLIGITGKIASGKSYIEDKLRQDEYVVFNCDDIVKSMYYTNKMIKDYAYLCEENHIIAREYFIVTKDFILKNIYSYKERWQAFLDIVHNQLKITLHNFIKQSYREKYIFISGFDLSKLDLKFDLILNVKCTTVKNLYRLFKRDRSMLKFKFWLKQTFTNYVYNIPVINITSDINIDELLEKKYNEPKTRN
jgi:dephospho-CoA kinase